jgi:hypothetical protein
MLFALISHLADSPLWRLNGYLVAVYVLLRKLDVIVGAFHRLLRRWLLESLVTDLCQEFVREQSERSVRRGKKPYDL